MAWLHSSLELVHAVGAYRDFFKVPKPPEKTRPTSPPSSKAHPAPFPSLPSLPTVLLQSHPGPSRLRRGWTELGTATEAAVVMGGGWIPPPCSVPQEQMWEGEAPQPIHYCCH